MQFRFPAYVDGCLACVQKLLTEGLPTPYHLGVRPAQWWKLAATLGLVPTNLQPRFALCKSATLAPILCEMLLDSAATSSGLERQFSTTKWVQASVFHKKLFVFHYHAPKNLRKTLGLSRLRTGLKIENVKRLAFCTRALHLCLLSRPVGFGMC